MAVVEGSEALVIAGLGRAREYGVEPRRVGRRVAGQSHPFLFTPSAETASGRD
jgi:hypothetical protein